MTEDERILMREHLARCEQIIKGIEFPLPSVVHFATRATLILNTFGRARFHFAFRLETTQVHDDIPLAFSCGARSAFKLKERDYLRNMLSRRQLQALVELSAARS